MDLCSPVEMRALLARHGFHFSKAKGQNFLTQRWVVEQLAEQAGVDGSCGALEIGPGIGPLTEQLCLRANKVVAIELDRTLQPILAETLGGQANLELIWADAMKLDLAQLVRERFAGLRPLACANLPYYITTPVLAKLLEANCFHSVTVMVQKEVAQRICAVPGSREYGAFSVFCHYYADPKLLFDVPPSCFVPQPKVTSSVLQLLVRGAPPCPVQDEATFFRVVRAGFAQRRKTLLNALAAGFPALGKTQLQALLLRCGLDPSIRAETLPLESFACLADEIFAEGSD